MGYIINIIVAYIIIQGVKNIIKTISEISKSSKKRDEDFKKIQDEYKRLLEEELRKATLKNQQRSKYSKWYKLDQRTRDKIIKVRTLVYRGEEGEKNAAQNRFNALLVKNNITATDVP